MRYAFYALAALAVVVVLLVVPKSWRRIKVRLKGLGTGLEVDASAHPKQNSPAIRMQEVKSRHGSIVAADNTGQGADLSKVEASQDVIVTTSSPPPSPKA